MKIVFLAPFGIRPKGTLIARMLPLAVAMQGLGHQVTIVAPPYTNPEDAGRTETVQGVKLLNVKLGPGSKTLSTFPVAWRMLRAALAEKPDAIHLFKPKGYGGIAAMLFYVLVYALATMGTFATLAYLGSARRDIDEVEELSGLARSQPVAAAALAVFMFSLAGLPPLAGFWGKFNLLGSAVELATSGSSDLARWFAILAIVGAINAAIAAAYYLRIVAVMYFQPAAGPVAAGGGVAALFASVLCAALVLATGAWPGRLLQMAVQSEAVFRPQSRTVQTPLLDRAAQLAQENGAR